MSTRPQPYRNRIESVEFPEAVDEPTTALVLSPEQRQALALPDRARAIVVRDQSDLSVANAFLQDINLLTLKISASFDPQIKQAHHLHASLIAEKKKFTDPLDAARRIVSPKVAEYLAEEDRKQMEAARARARAEAEATRLSDKAADKAYDLIKQGQVDKADALVEKAQAKVDDILATAPVVPETPIKPGLVQREDWKFEVMDAAKVPREYLCPDEQLIGRVVRARKGQLEIAGVRIYSVKSVNVRAS